MNDDTHDTTPAGYSAESEAVASLGARIAAARNETKPDSARMPEGIELGMRMVFDLLGGVTVGGFVGWQLDRWLGSAPWLLILCLLLGLAAGITGMVRLAGKTAQGMARNDANETK